MPGQRTPSAAMLLLLLLLGLFSSSGHAQLSQTYCSNQNTGSDTSPTWNQFQSNGACFETCKAEYAFAIIQYQLCWCSNFVPANEVSVSDCSENCPGYPDEQCGNRDGGLYGYIALSRAPSGTAGASSSTQTSTSQTPTSSSTLSTSASASASASASSTESEAPITNTQVVTVSGAIVTQTVTSTPRARPSANADSVQEQPEQSNTPTGIIVGAVVGSLAGLAFILLALFLLWRRRRQQGGGSTTSRRSVINRNASVLSKAGLLSSGRTHDQEKSMEEPRLGSQRQSALYDPPESPISAPGGVYGPGQMSRRNSRPLVYDQRLNPAALMENWQSNSSRTSIGTMQDQRDYSRPLGITNPDVPTRD
ncbi:Cell wall integrity and stress response component 1 [Sphaceloma murrayae]|uniref:Cell wall integrity and stress response component 1 n=1 Tax=Sphaceloma murrayae TaxID=2082308 RepID=A0A2K1QQW2_9PEZI|nr:Cell wall integrity and stress response component 1 [Sphaceloma murrayae]